MHANATHTSSTQIKRHEHSRAHLPMHQKNIFPGGQRSSTHPATLLKYTQPTQGDKPLNQVVCGSAARRPSYTRPAMCVGCSTSCFKPPPLQHLPKVVQGHVQCQCMRTAAAACGRYMSTRMTGLPIVPMCAWVVLLLLATPEQQGPGHRSISAVAARAGL